MINKLQSEEPGLQIISINLDRSDQVELAKLTKQNDIKYPVVADPSGEMERFFSIRVLPSTIMLNEAGKEVWRVLGNNKKHLSVKSSNLFR